MEKPALGRGLDALMSGRKGDSGKNATDMLMPFQAKRTRVGKGLGAFLKGGQRIDSTAEPQPADPAPAPVESPAKPALVQQPAPSLRASRPARPAPTPDLQPTSTPSNYRRSRRPRPANPESPTAPDKAEPGPAVAAHPVAATPKPTATAQPKNKVAPAAEPAFQRPFVRQRAPYLRKEDIPKPPEPTGASPAFRLSLFVVDLFLSGGAYYVTYFGPKGNYVLLFICCLAVVIGASLGVWSFKLEPDDEE